VLDAETIGQIAAGEVIERAASVVKELVENAVDADARRIVVSVERGGVQLVEVGDDGAGISRAQLPLALRRHATSKLTLATDLSAIATLGFRGEGLAAVAAVAQVEIVSSRRGESSAWRVRGHAETVSEPEPAAGAPGTRVRVAQLFDNVPVRREYLRSPAAEFARISSWLSSFALGYPGITFSLRHDGRDVWTMPAVEDARERLAMVFGREAAGALIPIDGAAATTISGGVRGFVSTPGFDRPDRRNQLLFVNGRLLRSPLMSAAWTAAYATFAMLGRHPYGVIFLELPPDHVDPNVHPTKSDVRLRFGSQVFDAVRRTIAATLQAHAAQRLQASTSATNAFALPVHAGDGASPVSLFDEAFAGTDLAQPQMRVLEQVARTYILAADGDTLLLVDQHAAHERIAYERIVDAARSGAPSEPLLVPLVVELDTEQSAALTELLETLREGGLEIEPFGEGVFRIIATPAGYGARQFDLAGFLDDLAAEGKQRDVRERVWASLACHCVCVAGERLERGEMTMLLERLQHCRNPMHCPHGRPTMVRLDSQDVARMFKRA